MAKKKKKGNKKVKQENGSFVVESGIERPRVVRTRASRYPWRSMEPGDSFLVAAAAEDQTATMKRLHQAAAYVRKATGRRFSTRRVDGGIRIWRVE